MERPAEAVRCLLGRVEGPFKVNGGLGVYHCGRALGGAVRHHLDRGVGGVRCQGCALGGAVCVEQMFCRRAPFGTGTGPNRTWAAYSDTSYSDNLLTVTIWAGPK